jgi:hypothetical protein
METKKKEKAIGIAEDPEGCPAQGQSEVSDLRRDHGEEEGTSIRIEVQMLLNRRWSDTECRTDPRGLLQEQRDNTAPLQFVSNGHWIASR